MGGHSAGSEPANAVENGIRTLGPPRAWLLVVTRR